MGKSDIRHLWAWPQNSWCDPPSQSFLSMVTPEAMCLRRQHHKIEVAWIPESVIGGDLLRRAVPLVPDCDMNE